VPPHPLVKHWLAVARNAQTPPAIFKSAITELSKLLLYECVRDMLPTTSAQVPTPMGVMADVEFVDPECPVAVVPVLRAGLAMAEGAQTMIPLSVTYHVGYVRDEETLEASAYLNKLPQSFDMDSKVVVLDIMLATGARASATAILVSLCSHAFTLLSHSSEAIMF
jgi:uracil phosphoribosyltransferase